MDMFFWFLIAIAVIAYLVSGGKRKRKGSVYKRKTDYQPPKRESYDRAPEVVREQSVAGVRLENGNYPTLSLFFVHITIH